MDRWNRIMKAVAMTTSMTLIGPALARAGVVEFYLASATVDRAPDATVFDTAYTGTVTIGADADTAITGVTIGPMANMVSVIDQLEGALHALAITLTLDQGVVTGGSVVFEVDADATPGGAVDSYTANLLTTGLPAITESVGQFAIYADTVDGLFVDGDGDQQFGGIDLAVFYDSNKNGIFEGWIILDGYDGSSHDADAGVLIHAPTPTAAAASLAMLGLIALGARHRRRQSRSTPLN